MMKHVVDVLPLLTVTDAARQLHLSESRVRQLANAGDLPCTLAGRSRPVRLFAAADLERLRRGPARRGRPMMTTATHYVPAERFRAGFEWARTDIKARIFEGTAVVFDHPVEGASEPTIIRRGAFKKTLQEQGDRLKVLWQHDPHRPIGRPVLRETGRGLEGTFYLDRVPDADAAWELVRSGTLTDLSIGFDVIQSRREVIDGVECRVITEARLWEVSVVTWGAQSVARIAAPANIHAALAEMSRFESAQGGKRNAARLRSVELTVKLMEAQARLS